MSDQKTTDRKQLCSRHCWEPGPEDPEDGCSTTCMLPDGHAGPHEWTRDSDIVVTFL